MHDFGTCPLPMGRAELVRFMALIIVPGSYIFGYNLRIRFKIFKNKFQSIYKIFVILLQNFNYVTVLW